MQEPRAEINQTNKIVHLKLSGDWKLGFKIPVFSKLDLGSQIGPESSISFETSQLGKWDSGLLVFIMNVVTFCDEQDIKLNVNSLPDNVCKLIQLATAVPEKKDARQEGPRLNFLARLGIGTLKQLAGAFEMLSFSGECALSVVALLTRRAKLRWRDFFAIVQECGPGALPIITLISFLVGLIIAFLGAVVLQRMAAEIYVSYIVGYGILREMGALMVGIIMAGRTGAAFAAEIGSMKVSEEIDAFKTLGISPIEFIVLPRMMAILLMMPMLVLFADFIGVIGGYFVASMMLDISTHQFFSGMKEVVGLSDFFLGIIKSIIFGAIIAFAGCLRGVQCGNSSGAVGIAATSAVVTSITFIVISNALIDWLATIYGF